MQHLLPKVPQYFKANLHTHTNISDGKMTPEEMIAKYKGAGYSILCLSDHNIIVDHSDKTTEDFLRTFGISSLQELPEIERVSFGEPAPEAVAEEGS